MSTPTLETMQKQLTEALNRIHSLEGDIKRMRSRGYDIRQSRQERLIVIHLWQRQGIEPAALETLQPEHERRCVVSGPSHPPASLCQ